MDNITLESLGAYLGFNPPISAPFKKETGTSFVEHLALSASGKGKGAFKGDRSQNPGYLPDGGPTADVRYFRKLSHALPALSPNEYRKIFA